MQRMRQTKKRSPIALVVVIMLVFVGCGLMIRELSRSVVVNNQVRNNFVMTSVDGVVSVVSFDPSEKRVVMIPLSQLLVRSRSAGEYKATQLYTLGSYDGEPGAFVKRKVQGFLKLPLTSYLISTKEGRDGLRYALWRQIFQGSYSTISRIDALYLLYSSYAYSFQTITTDELVREGVIVERENQEYEVLAQRLKQFVGSRFFDWRVGNEGVTVVVMNETGSDGLGSDVADFLMNVGMDVIAVRSDASQNRETTQVVFAKPESGKSASEVVLRMILGNAEFVYGRDLAEFRSEVVVRVGRDLLEMF